MLELVTSILDRQEWSYLSNWMHVEEDLPISEEDEHFSLTVNLCLSASWG